MNNIRKYFVESGLNLKGMDITLALGGGGVRGNSHIGVIRRLEQEGFRIRGLAGTSFGGMRYGLMLDVFLRSMDLLNRAVTDYRLELDQPDVIIRPRVGNIDTLDIINIREVVKIGEAAVDEVLPQLRKKFRLRMRIRCALGAKA